MFQRAMVAAVTDKRLRCAAAREAREREHARQARKAWVRRWERRVALLVVVVGVVGGAGWWVVRPKPGIYSTLAGERPHFRRGERLSLHQRPANLRATLPGRSTLGSA